MCDFVKNKTVGLYSDIYRLISSKLSLMIETATLHILIPVWMILSFVKGYSCIKKKSKTSASILSQIF